MKIDVTQQIESAKTLTREWAERAGYKQPPAEEPSEHSKKARDLARVLGASSFGCQDRNVRLLLEVLIDEPIPAPKRQAMVDYLRREPFAVGSVLVPANQYDGSQYARSGIVTRTSAQGNAGLRMSNGAMHNNHFQQHDLRPATDAEIDAYFSEFFGLTVNEADVPATAAVEPLDELVPDGEVPF